HLVLLSFPTRRSSDLHRPGYPRREGCAVSAAGDLASPNAARSCNAMADRPICSAGVNSALFLVREPKTLVDKPSGSMFANQLRRSEEHTSELQSLAYL